MTMIGYWNSTTLTSHSTAASWLAASTQTTARKPNGPLQDFTPGALPATNLPMHRAGK